MGKGDGWLARVAEKLQFLKNIWVVIGGIVVILLAGATHYYLVLAEQKKLRQELQDLQVALVLFIDSQRVTVPLLACREPIAGDLRVDLERIRCQAIQGEMRPFDARCHSADAVSKLPQIDDYAAMQEEDEDLLRCYCESQEDLALEAGSRQVRIEETVDR